MAKMFSKINVLLLAFVVGAVHSIHDPAYTGIKTKTYRRDPQIALAFQQQQQQQLNNHQPQQQPQHFTANQYQHATNYQPINGDVSERLSSGIPNQHKLQHQQQQRHQQHHHSEQEEDEQQQHQQHSVNSYQQELPIYERHVHERHGAPAPSSASSLIATRITNSNWDDAENAITEYYTGCPIHFTGQLPYIYDCRRFLNCWNGRGHIQSCSPGTVFNPDTLECDRPDKVVCGTVGRPVNHANYRSGRLMVDANVEHVPVLCPPGVTGLHPHPADCTKFLNCANGNVHVQSCGPGTAYSISMMVCDFKEKVDCSGRDGSTLGSSGGFDKSYAINTNYNDLDNNSNDGEEGLFCPTGVSGVFPYPFDHGKFMNCKRGNTAIQNCVPGTMFSISKGFCESSNIIDAHDHVTHTITDKNYEYFKSVITCPPGMAGEYLYPYDCQKYLSCLHDQRMLLEGCSPGMVFSHTERGCLPKQQVPPTHRVAERYSLDTQITATPSRPPTHATPRGSNAIVVTCPPSGLSGLYPYPFDCGKYLRCQNGEIIVELCPAGSVFSLSSKRCDLKERVDASHRVAFSQSDEVQQVQEVQQHQFDSNDYPKATFNNEENLNLICPPGMDGLFLHPFDCTAYLRCSQGQRFIEHCPSGTVFSISNQYCVASAQVNTFDRVDYSTSVSSSQASTAAQNIGHTHWNQQPANDRTDFARGAARRDDVTCPPGVSGFRPHPYDCTKFLRCVNGMTQIQQCGPGTAWDSSMEVCVLQDQADCSALQASSGDTTINSASRDYTRQSGMLQPTWPQYGTEEVACAPGLNGLYPHPFDCTKYLNCRDGRTIIQNCLAGSVFSISKRFCELKEDVENADRVSFVHEYGHELMEETERESLSRSGPSSDQISCPPGATGLHLHPFDSTKYLKCERGRAAVYSCPFGMLFSLSRKQCIARHQVAGSDNVGHMSESEGMVPKQWDSSGYNPSSDGRYSHVQCPDDYRGFLPHPDDCAKFVNCANGVPHIQDCAPGTAWNIQLQVCDFEDKVDCGNRFQTNPKGPEGGIKVECPEGASGIQPHPYDCKKFLNCANGLTQIQDCGPGTAWNQAMEVCDFEANVGCADGNQNSNNRGSKQYAYSGTHTNSRPVEPPSSWNPQLRPPTSQTVSTTQHQHHTQQNGYGSRTSTTYNHPQDVHHDRWTSMHMSRPDASPPLDNAQPHFYPENADNSQRPVNSNWNGIGNPTGHEISSTWADTGAVSSVRHQSSRQGVPNAENSYLQPNRNYAPTVRKYSTPLAPFSPSVTTPTTSTPIPPTDIQYAQPVGSQEDSQELFNNISGGDLSPGKPTVPTINRHDHSRDISNGNPTQTNAWTSTVVHSSNPIQPFRYSPIPNQNLLPPYPASDSHSNSQHEISSPHSESRDLRNLQSDTENTEQVPITYLVPPSLPEDSLQFQHSEPGNFNATTLVNLPSNVFPSDASNLYGGLLPPVPPPNTQLNGLQAPKPTSASHTSTTPETYLRPPLSPTVPIRPSNVHRENGETEAHVYRIYPSVRNESDQRYIGEPHYSPSYSGVAHSRNVSWSRNIGRKVPQSQTNPTFSTTSSTSTDGVSFSSPPPESVSIDSNYGVKGHTYNHQYYKTPTDSNAESIDPDMQKLPISDALRMLLRPYVNRSGTVSEEAVARAESHIMNLAISSSTTTTTTPTPATYPTTTIPPRTHIGEHEDDVELIFTDEQHGMVTVATKQNATHTTRTELYPSSPVNPREMKQGSYHGSGQKTKWHDEKFIRQGEPHSHSPFIPDERSSSDPSHDTNWPKHNHHPYHHHQHDINFHQRHPNITNPFETTSTTAAVTATKGVDRESTTSSAVYQGIDLRTGVDQNCPFDCGNNKCVKDFEVCDGINNCGNRQDEAQCDHLGYELRLAGGDNANSGRVEVKIFGKWGYVCDDKFGLLDADVVCRELGFNMGANEVRGNSFYAPAETNFSFIMDEVDCGGNESSLRECNFKGWGVNNCGPDEVVGVVCKVPLLKCPNNYWLCMQSKECIPPAFVCDNTPDCADKSDESERVCNSPIEYRLEGGRSVSEGRVEVMYRGEWGSVCDDDFGLNEAQVLCNSLGFYGKPNIEKNIFGPGSGPIWLDQVSCFGNETAIDKCNHWTWGEHNCNHTEDVGIRCTAGPPPKRSSSLVAVKGGQRVGESQRSLEESSFTLEDIGLYTGQWQRSSKLINRNSNQKRCGRFKQDLYDEYEHPEERVVNGTLAKRGHHPWQATIRTKGRGGISSHWCGAVLISKKHLLTAAHCLVGYPKGAYFIRLGDHYANIAESSETNSYIENWYIHEKFRDKTHMNNDIALIVLKNPVRFNDYVQPICLPEKGASLQVNRLCTISGWGSIKSGVSTPSNILRAAHLPILSDETCKQAHVYGNSMTEGMFCAGSMDESVDACDGDSGGPLVCSDEDGETLYGIISWGQQCGFANKPGVYVRVEKYIDWIYEKINFSMQQSMI